MRPPSAILIQLRWDSTDGPRDILESYLLRSCIMSGMADDSPVTSKRSDQDRLVLAEVDRALIEIVPGDLPEDQRHRDALQGLAVAASEWMKVVDLLPHLQPFRASRHRSSIRRLRNCLSSRTFKIGFRLTGYRSPNLISLPRWTF